MMKKILDFVFCRKRALKKSLLHSQIQVYTETEYQDNKQLNSNQIQQIKHSINSLIRIQQRCLAKCLSKQCQNIFVKTISYDNGKYQQCQLEQQSFKNQDFTQQIDALVIQLEDKFEEKAKVQQQINVVNQVFIAFLQRFDIELQNKIYFDKLNNISAKIQQIEQKLSI